MFQSPEAIVNWSAEIALWTGRVVSEDWPTSNQQRMTKGDQTIMG